MAAPTPLMLACGQCDTGKKKGKSLGQRLRHSIVIEQPARVADANGQMVETWTTFATVFAAIEPLRGQEFFAARQENAETTVRIRIRYLAGVTAEMRGNLDSKYYNIRSIIDPEYRHEELQLMCSEGANNG